MRNEVRWTEKAGMMFQANDRIASEILAVYKVSRQPLYAVLCVLLEIEAKRTSRLTRAVYPFRNEV